MLKVKQKLKELGILGLNQRNADYISRYNQRKLYPLVDDKLRTKQLALAHQIAVPQLYEVISIERQVKQLETILSQYSDFVIKPASGSGGDGILVITGKRRSLFQKSNGEYCDIEVIQHHVSNILSGLYSLGGQPDHALIEYRVKFNPIFDAISFQGVPDIRVLVFQGYPVMAMLRCPTRYSNGKANLHQGAVGLGIDIATGTTTHAVCQEQCIDHHPDTGEALSGLSLPDWQQLLTLAAGCYELTGLGYLGVDIVLDRNLGPLMLEVNARPGLSIQIANRAGLKPRLADIEERLDERCSVQQRVDFIIKQFGNTP